MLITSRRIGESICIDDNIEIFVLAITPGKVKLGIRAPNQVRVTRIALLLQVQEQNAAASRPPAYLEEVLTSSAGRGAGHPETTVSQGLPRPTRFPGKEGSV